MMKTTTKFVFALCTVLGLASCAQSPSSGSHDPQPRARSYSDTLDHVRGRGSVHAPSQIQIGSGNLDRKEHKTQEDRKSTRLNSSHVATSYAVFCLKKK